LKSIHWTDHKWFERFWEKLPDYFSLPLQHYYYNQLLLPNHLLIELCLLLKFTKNLGNMTSYRRVWKSKECFQHIAVWSLGSTLWINFLILLYILPSFQYSLWGTYPICSFIIIMLNQNFPSFYYGSKSIKSLIKKIQIKKLMCYFWI
jgi:hypothetical protein